MITNVTKRFGNNSLKRRVRVVFHWTGGVSSESTLNWLATRQGGQGTVGYNYILDKKDGIYMLADPRERWFHNTGLGSNYDAETVSAAFDMRDETEMFTEKQIDDTVKLLKIIDDWFDVIEITHHAAINKTKRDLPEELWQYLLSEIKIRQNR